MSRVNHYICSVAVGFAIASGAYAGPAASYTSGPVELSIEYTPLDAVSDEPSVIDVTAVVRNLNGEPVVDEQVRFVEDDCALYTGNGYVLDNKAQVSSHYTTRTDAEGRAHARYKIPTWSSEMVVNPIELGVWYHVDGGDNPYKRMFVLAAKPVCGAQADLTQQTAILPLEFESNKALSFVVRTVEQRSNRLEQAWVMPLGFDGPVRMASVRNSGAPDNNETNQSDTIDLTGYTDLAGVTPVATPISATFSHKDVDRAGNYFKTICTVTYLVNEGTNLWGYTVPSELPESSVVDNPCWLAPPARGTITVNAAPIDVESRGPASTTLLIKTSVGVTLNKLPPPAALTISRRFGRQVAHMANANLLYDTDEQCYETTARLPRPGDYRAITALSLGPLGGSVSATQEVSVIAHIQTAYERAKRCQWYWVVMMTTLSAVSMLTLRWL